MKKISVLVLSFILIFQYNCYALSAKSYAVIDSATGRTLMGENENEKLPMASTTKIMTALVALENSNPDDIVTVSKNAANTEGSSIYLKAGEKVIMRELLYGLMLSSGNDAAVAIAEHISGSTEAFSKKMTERAKELGAENTSFKNPNGLFEEGHYTTATDLALITRAALQNPTFAEIAATKSIRLSRSTYTNHNKLLSMYDGITGVKTGFTKKCGRCLVSSCGRNGFSLIAVTLNDPDDWNDHIFLYDKIYSEYHLTDIFAAGESAGEAETQDGNTANLIYKDNLNVFLNDDEKAKVSIIKDIPEAPGLPLYKGQKLGSAKAILGDIVLGESEIVCNEDVNVKKPLSFSNSFFNTVYLWFSAF